MTIHLTPMDEKKFNQYYNQSMSEYAEEHVKAGNWQKEEALENAQKQFQQLLPEGLATKDHMLFSVCNNEEPVGILWLHVQQSGSEKQAFIYDIELDESQRGKGLGKATMDALDRYAQTENIKKISLHVFAHNHRAIELYKNMGYQMTGHHMAKHLS